MSGDSDVEEMKLKQTIRIPSIRNRSCGVEKVEYTVDVYR